MNTIRYKSILFLIFMLGGITTNAQQHDSIQSKTSTNIQEGIENPADSLTQQKEHLPRRATMLSAVLPGLGQIYNKQAWKVPVIYAGFTGWAYGIAWNQQRYISSRKAYFDLTDGDPATSSYNDFFEVPITEEEAVNNYEQRFLQAIKGYNRQRTLVMVGTAAFYILNILDANVNAHFIDFNVSEDLTYNFKPIAIDPLTNNPIFGVSLAYNF
ncbi:MAG: DUF5683 domain-containing protein [Prolixibacteraceae bacterium]|nr:DUF5683 domain-containing protein [Prolixibacteraceae bacterium]